METVTVKVNNRLSVRTRRHKKLLEEEKFILKFIKYHLSLKNNYVYNRQFACQSFSRILIDHLLKNFNMLLSRSENKSMDIVISIIRKYFKKNHIEFFNSLNIDNQYKKKYKMLQSKLYHSNIIGNMNNTNVVIV